MKQLHIAALIVVVLCVACPALPLRAQYLPDTAGGGTSVSGLTVRCETIDTLFVDYSSYRYFNNPFQLKVTITNPTDSAYTNVRMMIWISEGLRAVPPIPVEPDSIAPNSSVELLYYLDAGYARLKPTNVCIRVYVYTNNNPVEYGDACVHFTALYRPTLSVACQIETSDTLRFNDRTGWTDRSELRVSAVISNSGPGQAYTVLGKLRLPKGMTLAGNGTVVKALDPADLPVGNAGRLEWIVQPGRIGSPGWVYFDVLVASRNEDTVRCRTWLYLQPFSKHVELSFPEYSFVRYRQPRSIPVRIGSTIGVGLSEYVLRLNYEPTTLRVIGVSTVGTLTERGWTVPELRNIDESTLEISASGNKLETDAGVLFNLEVEGALDREHGAGGFGWSVLSIPTVSSTLNLGAISFTSSDGIVVATDDCLEPLLAVDGSSLSQNRPNPFNPTTVIEYVLPEKEYIRLRVFDRHGRDVAVLFDGMQDAGRHTVSFDAENLPSGMYFYRLETARGIETKKMVLMR